MEKKKWKSLIKKNITENGIYRKSFDPVIETLADILEERDRVRQEYLDTGAKPLINKISDRGAVNAGKNPLLTTWDELNKTALQYWRDLGLTPAGLKKLDEESLKPKKENFSSLIGSLVGE